MAAVGHVLHLSLAAILLAGRVWAAEDVIEHELRQPEIPAGARTVEFRLEPHQAKKWARLLGATGSIVVNGTRVTYRPADAATSTIALSPYLKGSGWNVLDIPEPHGKMAIEFVPRVFIALIQPTGEKVRILVENTLENAANVQVSVDGHTPKDAYVPPESQVELEFPRPAAASFPVILTKFPEALEEGYTVRSWFRKRPESREFWN